MFVIDFTSAKSIVEDHLARPENRVMNDTWVICDDKTIHGEFGWMFFYTTKRHKETGDWRYQAPGNVPILVDPDGELCLAGSGARPEASVFAFVKNRADFRVRSLAPFNHFIAAACCRGCGSDKDIAFAAKIGVLSHKEYRIGDTAYPATPVDPATVAPAPNLGNSDFASHGLGICPVCRAALWAEVVIRKGSFHSLRIEQQPSDPEAWVRA
jgi:Immunity protein 35